jgi:hypothetical protein
METYMHGPLFTQMQTKKDVCMRARLEGNVEIDIRSFGGFSKIPDVGNFREAEL